MSESTQQSSLAGLRVLIVEDTALVSNELVRMLKRLGCTTVGPCGTLEEALVAAQSEPDLDGALLDINLRGQFVYPAAEALAAREIPFIFLTGYASDVIPAEFTDRPMLEKPFGQTDFVRAMTEFFQHPAA